MRLGLICSLQPACGGYFMWSTFDCTVIQKVTCDTQAELLIKNWRLLLAYKNTQTETLHLNSSTSTMTSCYCLLTSLTGSILFRYWNCSPSCTNHRIPQFAMAVTTSCKTFSQVIGKQRWQLLNNPGHSSDTQLLSGWIMQNSFGYISSKSRSVSRTAIFKLFHLRDCWQDTKIIRAHDQFLEN